MGDGRDNVADSLLVCGSMLGVNVHIVTPKPLFTHPDVQKIAQNFAQDSGSKNLITDDIAQGVKGANVVYTDVWVSMGENDWSERIKLLKPYTVTMKMMQMTGTPDDQLIFMHCLTAVKQCIKINWSSGVPVICIIFIVTVYGFNNLIRSDQSFSPIETQTSV